MKSRFFAWLFGTTVVRVYDGDTFDLENGTRVRLWSIDAAGG